MRKSKPVALISAGKLADSPVSRSWRLSERLGPVKSTSFRLANRIANSLRAGHAVKDYDAFEDCRLVVVSVPDKLLPQVVRELASSGISWRGKSMVVCSSWLDSDVLREFSARGAAVASLATIPGFEDALYVVEGDRPAILECRPLVERRGRRVVPIERSLKLFYLAALTCTGSLLCGLLLGAGECLRRAGISSPMSEAILEKQLSKTLRSSLKAGRKAWAAPQALDGQLRALAAADPELARYLAEAARITERLLEKR